MEKLFPLLVVGIFILSGLGAFGISNNIKRIENEKSYFFDDISSYKCYIASGGKVKDQNYEIIQNIGRDYPIGETIWKYTLTIYDPSPKAIAPIEDIDGDDVGDVIVCSEDDYVRCFEGGAIGTGNWIWEHEIYAGDIYSQKGLDIIEDVDGDGVEDIVVGATGGARLIRCISGDDGSTIWTHDTHEYGNGGWVYQVNCSYDYNGDGVTDVLATCGDDSSDNGPKRVYCLDGEDGDSIWERPLGGPGFSVIGVEDFTGDGQPDVLAGCSNEAETIGYAKGINGDTGTQVWSKTTSGSSVWALEQIEDITGDGVKDVIVGDFSGNIYGLDATDGGQEYSRSIGTAIITRFAKLNDVDYSGHPEIVPAHSTTHTTQLIDAEDGDIVWSHGVADQPWNAARISDVSGDGIDDVLIGTLFNTNYCYFLDGTDGSELESIAYGQAVDAINSIPDVVSDNSMEMVAGGRNGKLTCISGGLDASPPNDPPTPPIITGPSIGAVNWPYCFEIVSTDPDGDSVYYMVDWGDGTQIEWLGPYPQGELAEVCHTWTAIGTYYIIARAKDDKGAESIWTDPFEITIVEDEPPNEPSIEGPTNGKVGIKYDYTFVATDNDGDNLTYIVDWGDGTPIELFGPAASGEEISASHTWEEKGKYVIIVKAKDIYQVESNSTTLTMIITKDRPVGKTYINFIQNYKNLFPLIRLLFERLGL